MTEPLITPEQLQATVDAKCAYKHPETALDLIQAWSRLTDNCVAWAEDIQRRVVDPIISVDANLQAKIAAETAFFMEVIFVASALKNDPKFAPLIAFVPNEQATYQPPPPPTPEELAIQIAQGAVNTAQNALDEETAKDVPDQATVDALTAALADAQAALNALAGGA